MRSPARVRALLALAAALPALAGCEASSQVLAANISLGVADTTFALRVGQEARVGGTVLRIAFLAVTEDSRCPTQVMCIWAGNAAVRIGVAFGTGPTVPYVLNTFSDPHAAELGSYRVTLLRLDPYPVQPAPIPADRYVATFRLQRLGYAPD